MLNIDIKELAVINLKKDIQITLLEGQVRQLAQQIGRLNKELEKYKPTKQEEKRNVKK